ncbi:MAG: hypothetical protein AcusKO_12140 [Acuticoccus sp.]
MLKMLQETTGTDERAGAPDARGGASPLSAALGSSLDADFRGLARTIARRRRQPLPAAPDAGSDGPFADGPAPDETAAAPVPPPSTTPSLMDGADQADVARLEKRIDYLEARIAELERLAGERAPATAPHAAAPEPAPAARPATATSHFARARARAEAVAARNGPISEAAATPDRPSDSPRRLWRY